MSAEWYVVEYLGETGVPLYFANDGGMVPASHPAPGVAEAPGVACYTFAAAGRAIESRGVDARRCRVRSVAEFKVGVR